MELLGVSVGNFGDLLEWYPYSPVKFGMLLVHILPGSILWGCPEVSFWSHTQKTQPYCCHCSMVTYLQPTAVLLCLPHIWHSCFVWFCGWFEAGKPKPPHAQSGRGAPITPRSVHSSGRPQLHVQLQWEHLKCTPGSSPWPLSLLGQSPVLRRGISMVLFCCSQGVFSSPFAFPVSPDTASPRFGTRHWNFHWGMLSCLSSTGISFFLITGVRCWSDWQITCEQHREKLQVFYLWFSSLFCAVFLSPCWFERCTHTEMSLLREFAVLGIWSAVLKSYTAFLVIFFHHQAGQKLRRPPTTAAVLAGVLGCCWGWADWCSQNVPVPWWTTLGGCSPPCEMQSYSGDVQGMDRVTAHHN